MHVLLLQNHRVSLVVAPAARPPWHNLPSWVATNAGARPTSPADFMKFHAPCRLDKFHDEFHEILGWANRRRPRRRPHRRPCRAAGLDTIHRRHRAITIAPSPSPPLLLPPPQPPPSLPSPSASPPPPSRRRSPRRIRRRRCHMHTVYVRLIRAVPSHI